MATFTKQEIMDLDPCKPWSPVLIQQCPLDPLTGEEIMGYVVALGYDLSVLNFIVGSHLALAQELIGVAGLGVDLPDANRQTALHYAVFKRQPDVITYLLSEGAEKELPNSRGITPRVAAIMSDDAAVMAAMGV